MACSSISRVFLQRLSAKMLKTGWKKRKRLLLTKLSLTLGCQRHQSTGHPQRSTIFALSTPPGMSAIAVIRISGPNTANLFQKVAKLQNPPNARKATLCWLKDPETGEPLDKALLLWFPAPNSFSGEDLCELHIHGGVAVIKSVLNALRKLCHFRFAEPGEFTKRAFMAGKLDLTEVEGLADLLHAETEAQQRQALRQMDGALHKLYANWSERVKNCLARIEAYIDFSEDQHLDESIFISVKSELKTLREEITKHLQDNRKGEKLRSGVQAVIIGRPNVGKSSLLNLLCHRDVAIVSSTAGTTRDVLETSLNLGGYLVNICDTAGIRDSPDSVEQEGVKRAKDRSSKADLLIFILEAKRILDFLSSNFVPKEDLLKFLLIKELGESFVSPSSATEDCSSVVLLVNKTDLLNAEELKRIQDLMDMYPSLCAVSCADGSGLTQFVQTFSEKVKEICCGHRGEEPTITQERHRHYVEDCLQNLCEYEEFVSVDAAIAAEKLRSGMTALGRVTGRVRTEEILDVIFRDFCIGK